MKIISSFSGDHAFLSNFHPSPITIGERTYPTNEHFFQAHKFRVGSREHQDVIEAKTPGLAKKVARGRHMTERQKAYWDRKKIGVMLAGLRRKFSDPKLRRQLDATKDFYLIEGNTWNDRFWGQTLTYESDRFELNEGVGLNVLGSLLMIVRGERATSFTVPILNDLWDEF